MHTIVRDADLIDFLLQRIKEDEDRVLQALVDNEPDHAWSYGPAAQQVLDDCAARRVIVDGVRALDDTLGDYGVAAPFDGTDVLRWMATPYARHPQYHDAWRP